MRYLLHRAILAPSAELLQPLSGALITIIVVVLSEEQEVVGHAASVYEVSCVILVMLALRNFKKIRPLWPQQSSISLGGRRIMAIDVEQAVRTFMEAAGQGKSDDKAVVDLRLALIDEEYTELVEALSWGDPVHIAKELADLVYVVVGTAIALGIPFNEVFAALQTSNMSKVGPDGKVTKREDGKILKGDTYIAAENAIREILGGK